MLGRNFSWSWDWSYQSIGEKDFTFYLHPTFTVGREKMANWTWYTLNLSLWQFTVSVCLDVQNR